MAVERDLIRGMSRVEGNTNRAGHGQSQVVYLDGLAEGEEQFFSDPQRLINFPNVVQEGHELVPADAGNRVAAAQLPFHAVRGLL